MYKIIIIILLFACCNAYKGITKHAPETAKDTLRLAERSAKTFPKPKPKVITVYKKMADSSAYFKRLADSVKGLKITVIDSLAIIYKDTCTEVIDSYKNGFQLGYEVGVYDCKQRVRIDTLRVDSTIIDVVEVTALRIKLQQQYLETEKYRSKSVRRGSMLLWVIIALAASVLGNVILIKLKKIKL